MKNIHWLGSGLSSIPGIRRLASNNHNLTVWNRTLSKAQNSINHVKTDKVSAKIFNIDEIAEKVGKKQVQIWRRSFEVSPPGGESLKNVVERVKPYFDVNIEPEIKNKKNILIAAHGNSLRAMMICIGYYQPEEISKIELPTGSPLVFYYKEGELIKSEYVV